MVASLGWMGIWSFHWETLNASVSRCFFWDHLASLEKDPTSWGGLLVFREGDGVLIQYMDFHLLLLVSLPTVYCACLPTLNTKPPVSCWVGEEWDGCVPNFLLVFSCLVFEILLPPVPGPVWGLWQELASFLLASLLQAALTLALSAL